MTAITSAAIGSALGENFFQQMLTAIITAFVFMSIIVFIYFRVPIPSLAVILSAFADIVGTIAVINISGMKVSTAGIVALLQGIAAVADNNLFVVGINYTYKFDITTWGWIHIILGIIGIVVALGLFTGAVWARAAAIVIASLSIIANFLWMPYYPLWSILVIALDVVVIWAVATWDTDRV